MTMTAEGIIRDKRPNQPREDSYTTPDIPLRGLNIGGKYSADAVQAGTLPLALHHVIPWNLLRTFWNMMQKNGYWTSLAVYGSMLGVAQSTMRTLTTGMKKKKFGNAIDLDVKICWAEWNLVRGPEHRSDDPGEHLDDMQSSYGIEANNQRIMFLIDHGKQMKRLITAMPRESDVRKMIDSMKRTLNRQKIMEFDRNIWRVGSSSVEFVAATRDSFATQPLWQIRGPLSK
jgi:hypothetical protein